MLSMDERNNVIQKLTEKKSNMEHNKDYYISCICVTFLVITIVPILIFSGCSLPAADDFGITNQVIKSLQEKSNYYQVAFTMVYEFYMNWGGFYTGMFLAYFCCPFARWGIEGVRICNILCHLVFFASSYFLITTCSNYYFKKNNTKWIYLSAFIFLLNNSGINSEVYTWSGVLLAYVCSVALLFVSLGTYLHALVYKNGKLFLLSGVFSFLVGGAPLNVAVFGCELFLLLSAYGYFRLKRGWYSIFAFGCIIIGTLINVVAPGNYIRHEVITSSYSIFPAIAATGKIVIELFYEKLYRSCLVPVALIGFIFAYKNLDINNIKLSFRHPIMVFFIETIGLIIINFPVIYGYGGSRYFPDRVVWVHDVAFYIFFISWIVYIAGTAQKYFGNLPLDKLLSAIVTPNTIFLRYKNSIVSGFCVYIVCLWLINTFTTQYMIDMITHKKLSEYVKCEMNVLSEITNTSDDEVTIYVKKASEPIKGFTNVGVSSDPLHWVNRQIATYYGKKKVTVFFSPQ